jgi:hypothetical protein
MYGLHLGKEDLKVYALLILFGERVRRQAGVEKADLINGQEKHNLSV